MFRIGFPGQNVPEWLEKVEVLEGGKLGTFKFGNLCVIWLRNNEYQIVTLLPGRPVFRLANCKNITIQGQRAGVAWKGSLVEMIQRKLLK